MTGDKVIDGWMSVVDGMRVRGMDKPYVTMVEKLVRELAEARQAIREFVALRPHDRGAIGFHQKRAQRYLAGDGKEKVLE